MDDLKRRGRRCLDGEHVSIPVTVPFPPKQYDRLCQEAKRQGQKLTELIRRKINQADEPSEDE